MCRTLPWAKCLVTESLGLGVVELTHDDGGGFFAGLEPLTVRIAQEWGVLPEVVADGKALGRAGRRTASALCHREVSLLILRGMSRS